MVIFLKSKVEVISSCGIEEVKRIVSKLIQSDPDTNPFIHRCKGKRLKQKLILERHDMFE